MKVLHDEKRNKFSINTKGVESYLLYSVVDEVTLSFYSTFVPDEARGMGIAAKLVEEGLNYAKANNYKVEPKCSYVEHFFNKRPELSKLKSS